MGNIKIDINQIFCLGTVCQLMGALLSRGKENQFTGRYFPLPFRCSQHTFTADNIEGFLIIVMKVVGISGLSRWDLIYADQCILRLAKGNEPAAKVLIAIMFAFMPNRNIFNFRMLDILPFKTLSVKSARLP